MLDALIGKVDSYPAMLKRIALYTGLITLATTWFLRRFSPEVDSVLDAVPALQVEQLGVKVRLGTFLPAGGVAIISRAFKLHDRVSDLFGIRRHFDVTRILLPLADACSASLDAKQKESVRRRRRELMNGVFYKYASSSEGKAAIDVHLIRMALDQWSWYWVVVEAMVVGMAAVVVFAIVNRAGAALVTAVVFLVPGVLLLFMLAGLCARKAEEQVVAVADDPQRRAEIARVFRAL